MRRVLIVSPHFPPTHAPDHQRVRLSLPYFRENGWDPVVLAVASENVNNPTDPLLAATVPADVSVHRVRAWSLRWTRLVGIGNLGYRAWRQLDAAGSRLLREGRFDLVFFSTTQFVVTTLGPRWRRQFGVPYIVDLQDPWRTDYYERPGAPRPPGGWKYRFARRQAARLEEKAWHEAAAFISVSPAYLRQLADRYPWFTGKPTAVIPFGASEADFAFAKSCELLAPAFTRESGMIHLVAVGAVGAIMRAALEQLFSGLRSLQNESPARAARLRFHFVGTSYASPDCATPSVLPVARGHGVADLVSEQTGRVGYFTAIKTMLAADAIVIPGSDDPGYHPSKIGNCFLAGKPVLALPLDGSALEKTLQDLNFATVAVHPAPAGSTTVRDFLHRLLTSPKPFGSTIRNEAEFSRRYGARVLTAQQAELFDRALASST